jgi:predicted enzyme related to lactoylglutathione lyase
MSTRDHAPAGAPCWVDLFTSDVDGSRRFYSELFGWVAEEPSEEFGGYFMFTRNGQPIAGGMGSMPEAPADDTWKIYLSTDDIAKTAETAEAQGAQVVVPPMPVADLGIQSVLVAPDGAVVGAWQPGTFPGILVLEEPGAPSWFELHTRQHATAVDFYRTVFHWEFSEVGDTDEFRYFTMKNPEGGDDLAGVMDNSTWVPEGTPGLWSVYWEVDDVAATLARVKELGGSVAMDAEETPYGVLAEAADPAGAKFKLRRAPGR